MAKLAKPEWVKFNFHRAKASPTWKLPDYLWCWYTKLWINSYDSDNPGYLPNDVDVLWKLAGARTKIFFANEGMSMVGLHFKRTEDGLWIYHPKVIETLKNFHTTNDLSTKKKIKIPLISSIDSGLTLLIYQDYPIHVGRKAALASIEKAISRYAHENKLEALAATEFIHKAVIEFAASPAGRKRKPETGESLVPHPATWFNQDRFLDDRSHWYEESTPAASKARQRTVANVTSIAKGFGFGEVADAGSGEREDRSEYADGPTLEGVSGPVPD